LRGDTVSVGINRFADGGIRFPAESVPVARWVTSGPSGYLTAALIPVSVTGELRTARLHFYRYDRLCRNLAVFRMTGQDSTTPADFGLPTVQLDGARDSISWWYASHDGTRVVASSEHDSWIYDCRTGKVACSDTVPMWGISSFGDRFAALQFTSGPPSRGRRERVVLMTWSGDLLWASPWLTNGHSFIHLFPDAWTIYYVLDDTKLYCKLPGDAAAQPVHGVSSGISRFSSDGSRMLVLVRDKLDDTAAVYGLLTPTHPAELFRRRWPGCLVADGAVSASGTRFALLLQASSATNGPLFSLVVLDAAGLEVFRKVLSESPPIGFTDEFLLVGAAVSRDEFQRDASSVEIYSCE
jgi:hypothetical protein